MSCPAHRCPRSARWRLRQIRRQDLRQQQCLRLHRHQRKRLDERRHHHRRQHGRQRLHQRRRHHRRLCTGHTSADASTDASANAGDRRRSHCSSCSTYAVVSPYASTNAGAFADTDADAHTSIDASTDASTNAIEQPRMISKFGLRE